MSACLFVLELWPDDRGRIVRRRASADPAPVLFASGVNASALASPASQSAHRVAPNGTFDATAVFRRLELLGDELPEVRV